MVENLHQQAVIFGGFRTEALDASVAVLTFLNTYDIDRSMTHFNVWQGPGDSLQKRHARSIQWLETHIDHKGKLHVLGYSMGAQLAIKFSQIVIDNRERGIHLGSVTLIAPDPKYRRVQLDNIEHQQGIVPAYDEALELWSMDSSVGRTFVGTLKSVANASECGCRVICCKKDEVAEWSENVAIMAKELKTCSSIHWIEVSMDQEARGHGIRFRPNDDNTPHNNGVESIHHALWSQLNFEAQTLGNSNYATTQQETT